MTPEQRAENEKWWRELADAEDAIPGGLTAGLPYPLRLLGNPPDPVKLAALEAEMTEWLANGGVQKALAQVLTPEERLKAAEEEVAGLLRHGISVPPNYLQVKREDAKRARQALDAAAAPRPAPAEPSR